MKNAWCKEAAILHQMILHQTFLHLGADRDMAGWHGSTGHAPKIPLLMLGTNPANRPAVCWIGSRPLGVIYLQRRIDRLCFYTLVHTAVLTFLVGLLWGAADGLFLQVSVLRDVHGLLLLPAAGSHVLCHWCEGLVGRATIHIPRYWLISKHLKCYSGVYCSVQIQPSETWLAHDCNV